MLLTPTMTTTADHHRHDLLTDAARIRLTAATPTTGDSHLRTTKSTGLFALVRSSVRFALSSLASVGITQTMN
jgi:hypothetical protein